MMTIPLKLFCLVFILPAYRAQEIDPRVLELLKNSTGLELPLNIINNNASLASTTTTTSPSTAPPPPLTTSSSPSILKMNDTKSEGNETRLNGSEIDFEEKKDDESVKLIPEAKNASDHNINNSNNPCEDEKDLIKCFELIAVEMNKTEVLLKMANKTLGENDENNKEETTTSIPLPVHLDNDDLDFFRRSEIPSTLHDHIQLHDPGFDLHQQQQREPLSQPPQANAVLHEPQQLQQHEQPQQQPLPPLHLLPDKQSYRAPDPNLMPQALPVLGQPQPQPQPMPMMRPQPPPQQQPHFMSWPPSDSMRRRKRRSISLKDAKEVKIKREFAQKMLAQIATKAKELEDQRKDFSSLRNRGASKQEPAKVEVMAEFQMRRRKRSLRFDPKLLLGRVSGNKKSHRDNKNGAVAKMDVLQILDILLKDKKLDERLRAKLLRARAKMTRINSAIEQDSVNTGKQINDTINKVKVIKNILEQNRHKRQISQDQLNLLLQQQLKQQQELLAQQQQPQPLLNFDAVKKESNTTSTTTTAAPNNTTSNSTSKGIAGFFNSLFGGGNKKNGTDNNNNNTTTQKPTLNTTKSGLNFKSVPLFNNKMSKDEKEEAELEATPKGLVLQVIKKGESKLNVGDKVDGNLNVIKNEGGQNKTKEEIFVRLLNGTIIKQGQNSNDDDKKKNNNINNLIEKFNTGDNKTGPKPEDKKPNSTSVLNLLSSNNGNKKNESAVGLLKSPESSRVLLNKESNNVNNNNNPFLLHGQQMPSSLLGEPSHPLLTPERVTADDNNSDLQQRLNNNPLRQQQQQMQNGNILGL